MHGYDGPPVGSTATHRLRSRPLFADQEEVPAVDQSQLGIKASHLEEMACDVEQAAENLVLLVNAVTGSNAAPPSNRVVPTTAPPLTHLHRIEGVGSRIGDALTIIRAATMALRDAVG